MASMRHLTWISGGLLLAACAVGPDYRAPAPAVPESWQQPSAAAPESAELAGWWTTLGDRILDRLVEQSLAGSPTVRQASARVLEARARRGIAAAGLAPSVEASARADVVDAERGTTSTPGSDATDETWSTGLDASWEIDLFGGQRRSVESADAQLGAAEAELRDVLITLLGDVALSYVDVRTAQARLTFAERNLEAQRELTDITRWQAEAGLATSLEVQQANSSYEQTRAAIPSLESALAQAMNRLAVLTGRPPGELDELLAERRPIPVAPLDIAAGVPADVLRRRPDIRAAERRLAAQTAQVGVATAALYPSLTLAGAISLNSTSAGDLFDGLRTDRAGLSISLPIFNAGALRQNVRAQNALVDQAAATYESTVLAAYEEVDNALTAWSNEHRRNSALIAAAASARVASELALMQYNSGLVDFETVLTADRQLISTEDALAVSNGELTAGLVRLYKALGGGWSVYPEAARLDVIE